MPSASKIRSAGNSHGTVRDITFLEGVQRLILAGPKEMSAEFRRDLPNELRERVVAEEQVNIGEAGGELLDDLEAIRERGIRVPTRP